MTIAEERAIIKEVIDGNKDAFEKLVLANQSNIYNLALKMTRNAEDALDISQEAFIKAYRSLAGFRFDARFSVWLYKMTYNLCIDALRRQKGKETAALDAGGDDGNCAALPEIPDTRELPEQSVLRRETRKIIADSISQLPPGHREILIMREITGMSYDDMALALGTSPGTVKSRLSRARQKLSGILLKKGTFPEGYRHNKREEEQQHDQV